jgi:hypothetical protein
MKDYLPGLGAHFDTKRTNQPLSSDSMLHTVDKSFQTQLWTHQGKEQTDMLTDKHSVLVFMLC